jgi:hypothetical protein
VPIDGLWIAKFAAGQLTGSGVVVFANGKLFGGETGFYYLGSYDADGTIFKAHIVVRNFDPSIPSGFGIATDYEMDVSGILQGDEMTGTAVITGYPQYSLGIRATKKANI